ncbi:hypothetical protein NC653_021934 [Populus alba x Populus x berolinensis]|uniref:Uncharacterized protein n=1 Tax=Populus alba x Populus x berolinensis TaxID=444605 RepID=A0AAD6QF35_9ROSI|nr:hypothetical protein NC653_021934 [Populus alba x Populus x berolinensis]
MKPRRDSSPKLSKRETQRRPIVEDSYRSDLKSHVGCSATCVLRSPLPGSPPYASYYISVVGPTLMVCFVPLDLRLVPCILFRVIAAHTVHVIHSNPNDALIQIGVKVAWRAPTPRSR